MSGSSNKLVDKYQYNQSQVRTEGLCEFITAKHIVLKEYYTLKKISINTSNTLSKYNGVINQMNILKVLNHLMPNSSTIIKCHKMLKTSNNLYVVFDLIGSNPNLHQYLLVHNQMNQQKKRLLVIQILNFLKQLTQNNMFYLNLSPFIIQVNSAGNIKFLNFEGLILSNKNISSFTFQNIQISQYVAPQLKQFISSVQFPYQKQLDFNIFSQRLDKAHIYSFGKILQLIYQKEIKIVQGSKVNETQQLALQFQCKVKILTDQMTQNDSQKRPTLEQIESIFTFKNSEEKKPKIKISRFLTNIQVMNSHTLDFQSCKSPSRMNKSKVTSINQYLSPPQDQFDKKSQKSIKSSGQFSSNNHSLKIKKRTSSFANTDTDQSMEQFWKILVLKIMKRRNLCKFLLKLAGIIFSTQLIQKTFRLMLSFMLIKKSVLLICSLARYVSTGKGQLEQFDFKDTVRKQFSKTNDFFKLSVSINKQMDAARNLYVSCINQINNEFPQLAQIKQFAFDYECKSQNLNEKFMKQLIKKAAVQILKKISSPSHKTTQNSKKPSSNFLSPQKLAQNSFLSASNRSTRNNILQVEDITVSVRSARSVKSYLSGGSSVTQKNMPVFQSEVVKRNISSDNLIYIYLMVLILDYQTFENFFQTNIVQQKAPLQQQIFFLKLKKMQPNQIAIHISQKVN